jgi:hypothetical protein
VDAGILILLIWLWCWDLPSDLPSRKAVTLISRPLIWLGLWHGWAMFAPEPIHVNRRLKALIKYTDGTVDEWRPHEPRHSSSTPTGWFLDTLWFRHFKFQFSLLNGTDKVLWKPMCQWLAREVADPRLSVVSIQLIREYQRVLPQGSAEPRSPWESTGMHEEKMAG